MKVIAKNVSTGTLILNGVSSGVIASINTANLLAHNLDNCVIFIEGVLLCGNSTGKVAVHKAHALFKKISGTVSAVIGVAGPLSGVDIMLEENPLMVGAITFSFNIVGNVINLNVNNTSALNITAEGIINVMCGFATATYIDNIVTFL